MWSLLLENSLSQYLNQRAWLHAAKTVFTKTVCGLALAPAVYASPCNVIENSFIYKLLQTYKSTLRHLRNFYVAFNSIDFY